MKKNQRELDLLINEANSHYKTDRFKDAAKTFSHLMDIALQDGDPEEAIYFGYRVADSWKNAKDELNRAKTFRVIAEIAYKSSVLVAEKFSKKIKDPLKKHEALMIIAEYYLSNGNKAKAKKYVDKTVQALEEALENETKNDKKELIISKIIAAAKLIDNKRKTKDSYLRLIEIKKELIQDSLANKSLENVTKAIRQYEDIENILATLKMKKDENIEKEIKKLKKVLSEFDPFST